MTWRAQIGTLYIQTLYLAYLAFKQYSNATLQLFHLAEVTADNAADAEREVEGHYDEAEGSYREESDELVHPGKKTGSAAAHGSLVV